MKISGLGRCTSPCGNAFVRDPEGALIGPHEGITGRGELSAALYDWNGAVARITIERAS